MIYPLYKHNGIWYKILRRVYHHNFNHTNEVKEFRDCIYGCDHVLKDRTHYLFCETVQEEKRGQMNGVVAELTSVILKEIKKEKENERLQKTN